MNIGDKQTFYPATPGLGLDSNFCCGYLGNESSFDDDPDLNDENDDQESTEYENEEAEVPDVKDKCPFGEFRTLVKAKKQELKAQYGKGKLNILACGVKPARLSYNPNVKIPKTYWPFSGCGLNPDLRPEYFPTLCTWNCSKHPDKDCCKTNEAKHNNKVAAWAEFHACQDRQGKVANPGTENEDAYDRATARWDADMAIYHACAAEHPLWQSGWRREWRKFKKAGGLNELKDKCRGVLPPQTPSVDSGLNCTQLRTTYGIIAGQSWGTAPANIIQEWKTKACKGPAKIVPGEKGVFVPGMSCYDIMNQFGIVPGKSWGNASPEAISEWKKLKCTGQETNITQGSRVVSDNSDLEKEKQKKMIIIGVIAVVVIIGIALVVRAMKSKM